VSYDDYPKRQYPPYANGFAYFLTQDYISDMLRYLSGRKLFPVEDVQLTGIAADAIGADRVLSYLDHVGNMTFNGDCSFLGRWLNDTEADHATLPVAVLCFDTNYVEFARQKLAVHRLQRFGRTKLGLTGWPFY
jgi:hypothetical protein